jgi:hypothetical protein
MTPATKHKLFSFFEGSGKGVFLFIAGIVLTYFYTTFVTVPMPGNYVEKNAFVVLSQAHAKDIEKLQVDKMDRTEYEKRHNELKESQNAKFDLLIAQMHKIEKIDEKILNMHLNNKGRE